MLTEIENLKADELKARKAELVELAAKAEAPELAARYVQARYDATIRDEKLAEQGRTISALNAALETSAANLNTKIAQAIEIGRSLVDAKTEVERLTIEIESLKKQCGTIAAIAKRRRGVLADIMAAISPLLAEETA